MSDVFLRFQESLGRISPTVEGSRVEILLKLLEPKIAQLLRLCAIPHEFDPHLLSVLSPGLSNTDQLFEKLARIPFVTLMTDEAVMHDQIRRELFSFWLKEGNRISFASTSQRLSEHFEAKMSSADGWQRQRLAMNRMFHLIGADFAHGFEEFEILCRTARYQNRFSDCHCLVRLVHEYDSILPATLRARLTYHEAKLAADLRQWNSAEQLLRKITHDTLVESELRSASHFRLGVIYSDQGKHTIAIENYKEALGLLSHSSCKTALTYRIRGALGAAYRELNRLAEAQDMLETSLAEAQAMDDQSAIATINNSLGTLHIKLGNPEQAILHYTTSLECLKKTNDAYRSAQVRNNLGTLYADLGDWQKAEHHYQASLNISREGSDTWGQAKTLSNLSRLYQALKLPLKAIDVCRQAISIFKELHDFRNEAFAQRNLGRLYRAADQIEQSRAAFTDAIALFRRCSCLDEVVVTDQELNTLTHEIGLPWWAWATLVLCGLLILVLGIIFVVAMTN